MRRKGNTEMRKMAVLIVAALAVAAGMAIGQRWEYTGYFEYAYWPPLSTGLISGNFCILGTEVFRWDGTSWTFHQNLEREGQENYTSHEYESVCIQDDRCLAGVPMDFSQEDHYKGKVYAYRWIENKWQLEQKIEEDGTEYFGNSIVLDGNTAAIVAASNLYFYEYREGRWERTAHTTPCPENQAICEVAKSGDHWLVVGAIRSKPYPIVANMYRRDGDQWFLLDAIRFDGWVQDVVFKEDHLAVASGPDYEHTDLRIYHFDGQAWKPLQTYSCLENPWRNLGGIAFSSTPGELVLAEVLGSMEGYSIANLYEFQNGRWDLINRIESNSIGSDDPTYFVFPVLDHENLILPDGNGLVFSYRRCAAVDLTGDCQVDLADFALLAGEWMTGPGN